MRVHCDPASTLRPVRLELEIALARAAGRLSRVAGRGGGTTLPGRVAHRGRPERHDRSRRPALRRLRSCLGHERQDDDGSDGRGDSLPGLRIAHNAAGANLVSGIASALVASRDAELGLFEVDEAALPDVASAFGRGSFRSGTSFATSSIATASSSSSPERWRRMVAALAADTQLVVNADDPLVGELGRGTGRERDLRRRRSRPGAARAPARGGFEVLRPLRSTV